MPRRNAHEENYTRDTKRVKNDPGLEAFVKGFGTLSDEIGSEGFHDQPKFLEPLVFWFSFLILLGVFLRLLGMVDIYQVPGQRVILLPVFRERIHNLRKVASSLRHLILGRNKDLALVVAFSGDEQRLNRQLARGIIFRFTEQEDSEEIRNALKDITDFIEESDKMASRQVKNEKDEDGEVTPLSSAEELDAGFLDQDVFAFLYSEENDPEMKEMVLDIAYTLDDSEKVFDNLVGCGCSKAAKTEAFLLLGDIRRANDGVLNGIPPIRDGSPVTVRSMLESIYIAARRQHRGNECESRTCIQCGQRFLRHPMYKQRFYKERYKTNYSNPVRKLATQVLGGMTRHMSRESTASYLPGNTKFKDAEKVQYLQASNNMDNWDPGSRGFLTREQQDYVAEFLNPATAASLAVGGTL